jgi:hypothetical protein
MKHYIYVLKDPDTLNVRYVGETRDTIARLRTHVYYYQGTRKCDWVRMLIDADKIPILEIIEETVSELKKERERYWIEYFNNRNCNLLNMRQGGVREGSGRKQKFNEPTTVIRVPVSLIPEIKERMRQML